MKGFYHIGTRLGSFIILRSPGTYAVNSISSPVDKNSESINKTITFTQELPAGMYIMRAGNTQALTSRFVVVN